MNRGSERENAALLRVPSRFNEAPIHESGKSVVIAAERIIAVKASMRPRFMNRGSRADKYADSLARQLQ